MRGPRSRGFWRTASILVGLATACGSSGSESKFQDQDRNDAIGSAREPTPPPGGPGLPATGTPPAPDGGSGDDCGPNLTGVVRDFQGFDVGGHPDFERYGGGGQRRMVLPRLGPDEKPEYNPSPDPVPPGSEGLGNPDTSAKQRYVTSPESFAEWYRDTPGVNQSIPFRLVLTKGPGGISTYQNDHFFPIDGQGFGDSGKDRQGVVHNFGFTFELHTEFIYRGGEVFTFTGDDDLWTFINGNLAIDLGGLHHEETATVELDAAADALGIVKGNTYRLEVFHAERHTDASNFRIDTTIEFTNCAPIIR